MVDSSAWWPAIAILLTSAVTAISAATVYWAQKAADRKSALIELRRSIYREFISLIPQLADNTKDTQAKYLKLVAEMNVVATDDVLFAIGEFTKYMITNNARSGGQVDGETAKTLVAKIVLRMRKDCFSASKLDIEITKQLLPLR
jgi:hypothetical protein